jgi:hypothetical protein
MTCSLSGLSSIPAMLDRWEARANGPWFPGVPDDLSGPRAAPAA